MKLVTMFFAFLLFSSLANAGENCTCRYKGNDVSEGETICMFTPSGSQMAKCDRVLNNTSWKMLGLECPSADLQPTPSQSTGDLNESKALVQKLRG